MQTHCSLFNFTHILLLWVAIFLELNPFYLSSNTIHSSRFSSVLKFSISCSAHCTHYSSFPIRNFCRTNGFTTCHTTFESLGFKFRVDCKPLRQGHALYEESNNSNNYNILCLAKPNESNVIILLPTFVAEEMSHRRLLMFTREYNYWTTEVPFKNKLTCAYAFI